MSFRLLFPLVYLRHQRNAAADDPEKIMPRTRSVGTNGLGMPYTNTRTTMDRALPGMLDEDLEAAVITLRFRYTPLLAGVLIPFAILLEVPGLTERWYVQTYGDQTVNTQPNPAILDAGLALSMVAGVGANICLILRFLEWRIRLVTLLCIAFLTFHDVINTITVTVFGVQHRFDDGFTYGQAFWVTLCSTIVSVMTNILLIQDYIRTPKFSESGSGLTRKQRSLIIVIIAFLCYVSFCSIVNVYTVDANFIEALYFSLVTIQTIGFGDIVPVSDGARVWTCIYASIGVVFLGIVIGMLSDTVMEALQAGYSKRVMEVRLRRREAGKRRKRKLRYRKALEGYIRAKGAPIWIAADGRAAPRAPSDSTNPVHTAWNAISGRNTTGAGRGSGRSPFRLNTAVLSRAEIDAAAREADMPVVTYPGRARSRSRSRDRSTPEQIIERQASEDSENAIVLRSLDEYKDVLEAEKTKQFLVRFSMAWISFILFWIIGSLIFMKTEGWTYGVAMYFCFITFSTIGYGDYHIHTPAGRAVFVFWALLGVAAMTTLTAVVVDAFSAKYKSILHLHTFQKAVKMYRRQRLSLSMQPTLSIGLPAFTMPGPVVALPAAEPKPEDVPVTRTLSAQDRVTRANLETLPTEILEQARELEERVQYFAALTGRARDPDGNDTTTRVPPSLQRLLDDITHVEGVTQRVRTEVFKDEEARQTLFMLSVEEALHKMIAAAEQSLATLAERDRMISVKARQSSTTLATTSEPRS